MTGYTRRPRYPFGPDPRLSRRTILRSAAGLGLAAPLAGPVRFAGAQGTPVGGDQEGTLSVWSLTGDDLNAQLPEGAVERLGDAYPNVEYDLQQLQNDPFKTRLRTAIGSDSPPDIWHSWGGGVLAEYVK